MYEQDRHLNTLTASECATATPDCGPIESALNQGSAATERLFFALERLVRNAPDLTALSGGLQCIARLDLTTAPTDRGGPRATV